MAFDTNVFINCPFDDDYVPILRAVLFAVTALDFEPRIALEHFDSGQPRIAKITRLIRESKFSIHDISRLRAANAGDFFRLNMAFELGLDVGARSYGPELSDKQCLVLEAAQHNFPRALSDFAGSDIKAHGNDPRRALAEVRDWLAPASGVAAVGPTGLWNEFNLFNGDHFEVLAQKGYSPEDAQKQPVTELLPAMKAWVQQRRSKP